MNNTIFSQIKERISILDVVNEYATLKKAGNYWKGCCPFHHEKTASFTVSPHKEIFYCFGCHVGGDAISFIAKVENCSPIEAAQFLIDRYGLSITINAQSCEYQKTQDGKQSYFDLCKFIATWSHEQLKKSALAQQYLFKRGIHTSSIDAFMIGYFPGGAQAMRTCLESCNKQGILTADLIQAHIVSEKKNILFSPFEERIIFPIKDHLGRFCGFGGRVFKQHDERPKYYNSHENEFFNKGSLLFGLDLAKKTIQEKDTAFLVEGYLDCVMMSQYGHNNTIATLGTACTIQHLKAINRYTSQLNIIYDSDQAGIQAVLRLASICWQTNLDLKVVTLPNGQDPASFLAQGNDIQPYITRAYDIFEFFIATLGQDLASKSLSQKVDLTRKLLDVIMTVDDLLKQDFLLDRASQLLGIPFDSLKREVLRKNKITTDTSPQKSTPQTIDPQQLSRDPSLENRVFCAIMQNIHLFTKDAHDLLIEYMPAHLSEILLVIRSNIEGISFAKLLDIVTETQKQLISKLLLEHAEDIDAPLFDILVTQLYKRWWKQIVHDTQIKLASARKENDTLKVEKIVRDFLTCKQKVVSATSK